MNHILFPLIIFNQQSHNYILNNIAINFLHITIENNTFIPLKILHPWPKIRIVLFTASFWVHYKFFEDTLLGCSKRERINGSLPQTVIEIIELHQRFYLGVRIVRFCTLIATNIEYFDRYNSMLNFSEGILVIKCQIAWETRIDRQYTSVDCPMIDSYIC